MLFFSILKFSFHIVGSSGHEILEFVFFLFKLDLRNLFFVDQIIALETEGFALLDFVFQHKLEFLDVSFIELSAFEPFFFEEFNLNFKTSVNFSKLSVLDGVT